MHRIKIGKITAFLFAPILFLLLFLSGAGYANAAASLYLSPTSGSFVVGSTFTVSILLDTGGQAVNAIDASLIFPPNKLQVVSPSAGKSLVQTWITQPTYSNKDGTIQFQGIVPNPGITTDSGLISTITFRTRDIGQASIKFSDTSRVLLNDGRATDILNKASGGIFHITLPPPQGPIVVSRTNPDQEKWYTTPTVLFEWTASPDIQGYSYVLDENPVTTPDDISETDDGTRVAYNNVADGVHYFHIKGLRQGSWGGVTDYEIKIDRTPPAAFDVRISPSKYTSEKTPIISFLTTDAASGIDHYELAAIPVSKTEAQKNETPFFIETTSPYIGKFDIGRYQLIIKAYDSAGNYVQSQTAFSIVNQILEIVGDQGVRLWGVYTLGWPWAGVLAAFILGLLIYIARGAWKLHAKIEEHLRHGVAEHPAVAPKLEELKKKQDEYRDGGGTKALIIFGLIFTAGMAFALMNTGAASAAILKNIDDPEPPVITLYPTSISNDEIPYLGGEANVPDATVVIYLEELDTKATVQKTVVTDKNGRWFYSFGDFLDSGRYILWTQLKVGESLSPPSSRVEMIVQPTALQIGSRRFNAQDFYLIIAIIFMVAFAILLFITIYHSYHARRKSKRLNEEIKKAEESIRRGFSVLRRDIEDELATVHKMKINKGLSAEEKTREEKLLKDLEEITTYVGAEIWEIEKMEGNG
ncbi:MAG: cohesin domain-containing protein [Candidatus Liptonbacteria bacterium]|nr:cohesin domain-containing protein [Candidatus Liptonbacteria bacterium]